ncbi:MAG: RrF2 family transcriptional regulator [Bacteroidota bacterium]
MLSNTCKYAIRAVIYLAVNAGTENKIGIKRIAEDLSIPTPFLAKILQSLARKKVLSSSKGPNGGFGLGKEPDDIKIIDIVELIDGPDVFELCVIGMHTCKEQKSKCALHSTYAPIREELQTLFDYQTIGNLVNEVKSGRQDIIL